MTINFCTKFCNSQVQILNEKIKNIVSKSVKMSLKASRMQCIILHVFFLGIPWLTYPGFFNLLAFVLLPNRQSCEGSRPTFPSGHSWIGFEADGIAKTDSGNDWISVLSQITSLNVRFRIIFRSLGHKLISTLSWVKKYRSPNFKWKNCLAIMQEKVGPSFPSSLAVSNNPAGKSSISWGDS